MRHPLRWVPCSVGLSPAISQTSMNWFRCSERNCIGASTQADEGFDLHVLADIFLFLRKIKDKDLPIDNVEESRRFFADCADDLRG